MRAREVLAFYGWIFTRRTTWLLIGMFAGYWGVLWWLKK